MQSFEYTVDFTMRIDVLFESDLFTGPLYDKFADILDAFNRNTVYPGDVIELSVTAVVSAGQGSERDYTVAGNGGLVLTYESHTSSDFGFWYNAECDSLIFTYTHSGSVKTFEAEICFRDVDSVFSEYSFEGDPKDADPSVKVYRESDFDPSWSERWMKFSGEADGVTEYNLDS